NLGSNGFTVLLQPGNTYAVNPGATSLNTLGLLPSGSATYFLVQSSIAPTIGTDIDPSNTGTLDGDWQGQWNVLDTIALLDGTTNGDITSAALTYRHAPPGTGTTSFGTITDIGFDAQYVGRDGNTTGSTSTDWAVATVTGTQPNVTLGDPTTIPATY